jgi:Trypsin
MGQVVRLYSGGRGAIVKGREMHAALGCRAFSGVIVLLSLLICSGKPSFAIVGGAPAGKGIIGHVVGIATSDGGFCSGTVIGRHAVLTAAQCIHPNAGTKILDIRSNGRPVLKDVAVIIPNPKFDLSTLLAHRATADLALLKPAEPLGEIYRPVPVMSPSASAVATGERIVIAGYGLSVAGQFKSGGVLRSTQLIVVDNPDSLQIRLSDPKAQGEKSGAGACAGDSGGPALRVSAQGLVLIGLMSWSTGPGNEKGCGGLTGLVPIAPHIDWIWRTISSW